MLRRCVKAVAGTIFYAGVSTRLPPDLAFNNITQSIDYNAIKYLPFDVKEEVLHVISGSIRVRVFSSPFIEDQLN